MKNKMLILGCEGVLYPRDEIPMQTFVSAMKQTYRAELKIDGDTQSRIVEETLRSNRLGLYNYAKALCAEDSYDFNAFCLKMFDKVGCETLRRDDRLAQQLQTAAAQNDVVVWTGHPKVFLEKVVKARLGTTVDALAQEGIACYDLSSLEKNGVYLSKSDPEAVTRFLEKTGREAKDCVLIDDSASHLSAARKAGMQTVAIDDKNTLKQYLMIYEPNPAAERTGRTND
jgi:hypothetical protein